MMVIINNSKSNISVIWRFFLKKIHYEWKLSWVVNKWYRFHLFLQFASSFLKLNISYTNMINSIVHRLVCLYFKFTPKYLTRILSQYPLRMLTNLQKNIWQTPASDIITYVLCQIMHRYKYTSTCVGAWAAYITQKPLTLTAYVHNFKQTWSRYSRFISSFAL